MSFYMESFRDAAASLLESIYQRHAAGCCLHLVTDDHNFDDESVAHCFNVAVRTRHADCCALISLLSMFPESERPDLLEFAPEASGVLPS